MKIESNYDLIKLNTFGVPVHARFFTELHNQTDLAELFASSEFKENKKLFLGGGSNVLFTKDFDGIVILNKLKGIEIEVPEGSPRTPRGTLGNGNEEVLVRAMGGEVWHDLVSFAVGRGYWGIENLSFIPGTVGAAPMQNIGAYGAELKNVLESVEAYDINDGSKRVFSREECELGYRDSIFKNSLKDKYFIAAITLRLSKIENKNIKYKILQEYLKNNPPAGGEVKNSKDVSDAVVEIRKSKLPDPKVIGNAGSFFKNIFLTKDRMKEFLEKYPEVPYFEEEDVMKIPAGWLIEQCGWKGKRLGTVGVHDRQALVIVNHGGATGEEIKNLAEKIIDSVYEKFGLKLVPEVNFIE